MAQLQSGRGRLDGLVNVLLLVPELADPDAWDAAVEETERRLARDLEARRFPDHRRDVQSVLRACQACTGGLRSLARVLHGIYPAVFTADAVATADRIAGSELLSVPDRDALVDILRDVPVAQLAAAGERVEAGGPLSSEAAWTDIHATVLGLENASGEIASLLTFIDVLGSVTGPPNADELLQWADSVKGGLVFGHSALAPSVDTSRVPPDARVERPSVGGRPVRSRRADGSQPIWGGGVPIRNRNFTGRVALLDRLGTALRHGSKASVLPQTLQGMGGVGKTQLVVEYVYRNIDDYDLIWWIAAEQTATVLDSLAQLAERLGLTTTDDRRRTARTVLDSLADSGLSWLLVYDNVDEASILDQFVPSHGGHVIVTTRNQELASGWSSIAVDVFERGESIELLQRRSQDPHGQARISDAEADELADKLGDLPLALEQAVSWYLATAMPIRDYLELLDNQMSRELLSEGRPQGYPVTVAAFVKLAVERLRESAPATAQMFELFAFLGGEPVAVSLLRYGRDADIAEPLKSTLSVPLERSRVVRDLSRYGLAKVDQDERLQVHRLVQRVLQESLNDQQRRRALLNAQNILAAANPGDPDEVGELSRQRDLGAHLSAARMIAAENVAARQVILHHARYLYLTGNYEDSRDLAQQAVDAWSQDVTDPQYGPEGDFTVQAIALLANATRTLGDSERARELAQTAYTVMSRSAGFGERHESKLITGNQVGADLRIAGQYRDALEFDLRSVGLHDEVFGPFEKYTLRAKANLAVDYRMVGEFEKALALDREIATHWESMGGTDPRALSAYLNMARDYYGMGAYQAGLDVIDLWRGPLQQSLGPLHSQVLLAGRTYGVMLRKAGRREEAVTVLRDNHERVKERFDTRPNQERLKEGAKPDSNHEFALAAAMSLSNALREVGELEESLSLVTEALKRYDQYFGKQHPLALVARVNEAILRRARGELAEARALDERCFTALGTVLSPDHPYTLCAGTSLAADLALAGESARAVELSRQMLQLSRSYGGVHEARDNAEHPYLLMREVSLAHDLRATGEQAEADRVFGRAVTGLRKALGPNHPDIAAIERRQRPEGDVEPPPT